MRNRASYHGVLRAGRGGPPQPVLELAVPDRARAADLRRNHLARLARHGGVRRALPPRAAARLYAPPRGPQSDAARSRPHPIPGVARGDARGGARGRRRAHRVAGGEHRADCRHPHRRRTGSFPGGDRDRSPQRSRAGGGRRGCARRRPGPLPVLRQRQGGPRFLPGSLAGVRTIPDRSRQGGERDAGVRRTGSLFGTAQVFPVRAVRTGMDPRQQRGAEARQDVREAMSALGRALRRVSLHRHARESHASYLLPALRPLADLLDRRGSLALEVSPTALAYKGEPVYSEPAREGSLCFRLHRDGVRSITFLSGLDLEELVSFAAAALPDGGGGEDAVTKLWKAELRCVRVGAVSGYRLDGEPTGDTASDAASRANASLEPFGEGISAEDETPARPLT